MAIQGKGTAAGPEQDQAGPDEDGFQHHRLGALHEEDRHGCKEDADQGKGRHPDAESHEEEEGADHLETAHQGGEEPGKGESHGVEATDPVKVGGEKLAAPLEEEDTGDAHPQQEREDAGAGAEHDVAGRCIAGKGRGHPGS